MTSTRGRAPMAATSSRDAEASTRAATRTTSVDTSRRRAQSMTEMNERRRHGTMETRTRRTSATSGGDGPTATSDVHVLVVVDEGNPCVLYRISQLLMHIYKVYMIEWKVEDQFQYQQAYFFQTMKTWNRRLKPPLITIVQLHILNSYKKIFQKKKNTITIIIIIIIIIIVIIIGVIIINFILIIIFYWLPLLPTLFEVPWDEKNTLKSLSSSS